MTNLNKFIDKFLTSITKRLLGILSVITIAGSFGFSAANASGQDFSSLFEAVDPSVVTIQTQELVGSKRGTQQRGGIGAGVIIDEEGLIMTLSLIHI